MTAAPPVPIEYQLIGLTEDGNAGDLSAGIAQLDGLLAGQTRLTGAIARDTDGLKFRALRVANPALTLTADGQHALDHTDLTATLTVDNIGRIEPKAQGAAGLMLSLKGGGGPLDSMRS